MAEQTDREQQVNWRIEHVMKQNGPPSWDDVLALRDALTSLREEHARLVAEVEAERAHDLTDPAEQRAERFAMEACELTEAAEAREAALQQQLAEAVAPEELRQWKQAAEQATAREAALRKALATVHDLVQSACDDIDTYVDVDDGEDGQPVANKAMHAQCALEEAMTRLERLSQSSPIPPAQEK